jgi:transglutaminase-like putative cysteine protease
MARSVRNAEWRSAEHTLPDFGFILPQLFAVLFVGAIARAECKLGVASYTVRPGGAAAIGGDASHAWVSVYCPPLGWVDFDPTNDCLVGEGHVTLAWGRDFGDVSPLRGILFGGSRHKLSVDVRVQPLE